MNETKTTRHRTLRGTVIRGAKDKTIIVRVTSTRWHPKYHRQYRVSKKFKVHDENNEYAAGDAVVFVETRPFSKEKRWRAMKKVKTT